MIIDVHGHYTMAPPALDAYRGRQLSRMNKREAATLRFDAEEVRASLVPYVRQLDDRGIDIVLLSPRASGMGHEIGDESASRAWTTVCNDAIASAVSAFPDRFIGVAQLPQSPGVSPSECVDELDRCVEELDFVGFLVNPDVSGGVAPLTPSLGDEWWDPLWEAATRLKVPGLVHASATRHPAFHLNGSHYLAQDYAAAIEICNSNLLFERFPELGLIIGHGGGGVPLNMNRHRALHLAEGREDFETALRRLYIDTAVYDAATLRLTIDAMGADRVMFASEMFGTAKGRDPRTGRTFDDILPELLASTTEEEARMITHENALRAYPRLAEHSAVRVRVNKEAAAS